MKMIFALLIILVIGTGWVKNIIKLTECDFNTPLKCEIIHAIGLVPPIGMITGWRMSASKRILKRDTYKPSLSGYSRRWGGAQTGAATFEERKRENFNDYCNFIATKHGPG